MIITEVHNTDCGSDTTYSAFEEEFPEYDSTSYPAVLNDTSVVPVSPYDPNTRNIYREGYEFEINTNGWYNIDAFLKTGNGDIRDVKLIADLKMEQEMYMNVYVSVPTERVIQFTDQKKGDQYYFDYENGMMPLPIKHRAVLLAFGSYKDKIYYGIAEFTIEKEQVIPLEIKETTKEKLQNILFSRNLDGIELKATEKRMEIYKIPCDDTSGDSGYLPADTTARPRPK